MKYRLILTAVVISVTTSAVLNAQEDTRNVVTPAERADETSRGYVIGPGDHIRIWALGLEELFQNSFIIDPDGYLQAPLVGRIRVSGATATEVRANLVARLRSELRDPQVTVTVVEFKSRPVSVLGAVNTPGIHYVQGTKTLTQVLAMAGGLRPDAGHVIKITRKLASGTIPLATAHNDDSGQFSVAEIQLKSLIAVDHPAQNILLMGDDVITVPRAELIYVIGEVTRAGGFPLNERERITALQALSLAGGLTQTAAKGNARILRTVPGDPDRKEVPVNLARILAGKSADVQLQSDDILFVPSSMAKKMSAKVLETSLNLVTGVVIWRR